MEMNNCPECGNTLRGRIDKKFCSSLCRNSYHNRKRGYATRVVRDINRVLKKNRNILLQFNPEGTALISEKQLSSRGFNFDYYTSRFQVKPGDEYTFCYDQGYMREEEGKYKLIDRRSVQTRGL